MVSGAAGLLWSERALRAARRPGLRDGGAAPGFVRRRAQVADRLGSVAVVDRGRVHAAGALPLLHPADAPGERARVLLRDRETLVAAGRARRRLRPPDRVRPAPVR